MITLLTFWISCKYNQSPMLLYIGTVIIDLFALDIIGHWLCKKEIEDIKIKDEENGDDE